MGLLALVIALLALGLVGYDWQRDQQQKIAEKNDFSQLQSHLTAARDELQTQQLLLHQQQQAVNQLLQASGEKDRGWVLAEAEYLARLANFTLTFEHNPQVAEQLLKSADKRLSSLHDPSLVPVRKTLAGNIASLQQVEQLDLEGLLLKLDAVMASIPDLPVLGSEKSEHPIKKHKVHKHHHTSKHFDWRQGLEDSWDKLRSLVVIQRHDNVVKPLLTDEERMYLNQQLQMYLSQAQWAALHRKQHLYNEVLTNAQTWIKTYYSNNNNATQAALQQLDELNTTNIAPKLPDISESVRSIKGAMAVKQQQAAKPINKTTAKPKDAIPQEGKKS